MRSPALDMGEIAIPSILGFRRGSVTCVLSSNEMFLPRFLSCAVLEICCCCAKQHASLYWLSNYDPRLISKANTAGLISLEHHLVLISNED